MSYEVRTEEQLRDVVGAPHPELESKVSDHLDEFALAFIAASPFVVITTASKDGRQDASPKGDAPGFVTAADDRTLIVPDRPGNKLAYGHRNIIANPHVGLLFVIPNTPETLRVNGTAELTRDPELLDALAARGKPAVLATRVTVEECFFHCGKAFIRSDLWKPERWGERHRVSFGEMYRRQKGLDESVAKMVDASIEDDYKHNL